MHTALDYIPHIIPPPNICIYPKSVIKEVKPLTLGVWEQQSCLLVNVFLHWWEQTWPNLLESSQPAPNSLERVAQSTCCVLQTEWKNWRKWCTRRGRPWRCTVYILESLVCPTELLDFVLGQESANIFAEGQVADVFQLWGPPGSVMTPSSASMQKMQPQTNI